MTSPGPKGCRNQVLPRPDGLLEGWVGLTARLVFTSAFLSSMVGITTTGMRVHCSSVPSEDITSVYPSSQLHVLVCREQVFLHCAARKHSFLWAIRHNNMDDWTRRLFWWVLASKVPLHLFWCKFAPRIKGNYNKFNWKSRKWVWGWFEQMKD